MAAVGSCTRTTRRSADGMVITLNWTADSSGDMTLGGTTGKATFTAHGYLTHYRCLPGTTDPSDNYDVTLLDSDSIDVTRGQMVDQQNAAGQTYDTKYRSNLLNVDGGYLWFMNENLTLTIDNAGNLGTGTVILRFSRSITDEV